MPYGETTVFGKRHTRRPMYSDPVIQNMIIPQIGWPQEIYLQNAIHGDHCVLEPPYRETIVFRSHDPKCGPPMIGLLEEKYLNTDPIDIPPPPPPPNIKENDFEFPPYYVITKDTIYSNFYYKKSKSKIDISNLGEFISLNLNSKFDDKETNWRIKSLNDSVMILDRTIKYPHDNSYHIETEADLKLKKKR